VSIVSLYKDEFLNWLIFRKTRKHYQLNLFLTSLYCIMAQSPRDNLLDQTNLNISGWFIVTFTCKYDLWVKQLIVLIVNVYISQSFTDSNNFSETKRCSRCGVTKSIDNFLRARGTQIRPFASCNRCSEQKRRSLTNNSLIAERITQQPPQR